MRQATTGVVLLLTVSLAVAGCSSRPDTADTVDGPPATSTAKPQDEKTQTPAPVVEATSLTQEQIDASLLAQADMPEGWTLTPAEEGASPLGGEDSGTVYEPAECKALLEGLDSTDAERVPVAEGEVSFATEDFAFFSQVIETWDSW